MNINQFKTGDIITRVERAKTHYDLGIGDGSWINDKFEFVGVEKSMIVLIYLDFIFKNEIIKLESNEAWAEGWDYYPQGLIDKAKKRIKELKDKVVIMEKKDYEKFAESLRKNNSHFNRKKIPKPKYKNGRQKNNKLTK